MIKLEALRNSVPAIFAEEPAPGVSERYEFVSTLLILNPLLAEGWQIQRASQQATKKGVDKWGVHQVVLRHESMLETKEGVGEIYLINSHNRLKRLFFGAGFFRMVCSNGLIAMTAGVASKRLTHLDTVIKIDDVLSAVSSVAKEMPVLMGDIERFKKKSLSHEQQRLFASEVLETRYGAYEPTVSTEAVLTARRKADEGDSLWHTLNRVQENIMHGTVDNDRRSKPVTSLLEQVRINTKIWGLAQNYLNN